MMKILIAIIVLTITFTNTMEAQFEICHSNTDHSLNDVFFINENIGIAVGDWGTIVKSIDGGLNWDVKSSIDTIDFKKVIFFDEMRGLSIGNKIYATQDAGETWAVVNLPFENNYFNDIEILKDSIVIVSESPNRICKSYNYGVDWEVFVSDTLQYEILQMSFIDENIGYATHWEGSVTSSTLKTLDGGKTWIQILDSTGGDITLNEDISFVSEEIGFRGGWYNNLLMKTTDSADNWYETVPLDSSNMNPYWVGVFDFHIEEDQPNAYYACGWYGDVFKSTDGGNYWAELASPVSNSIALQGIFFINDDLGWAVGQNGTIVRITNGGEITEVKEEVENEIDIQVYPNPFSKEIQVSIASKYSIEEIFILDQTGRTIINTKQNRITTNQLTSGVYFLLVKTEQGVYSEKLIKQ